MPLVYRGALLCLLVTLTACSDGRVGYIIDAEGSMQRQTPQTIRAADERRLAAALRDDLAIDQDLQVDLGHDPIAAIADDDRRIWRYPALAVTIILPAALPTIDQARLENHTRRRLRRLHRERGSATTIAITVAENQSMAAEQDSDANHIQRYTIVAGDTLALIAAAFYGDAGRWRLLLDANPGLDPGDLQHGSVIVIPPVPSTTP